MKKIIILVFILIGVLFCLQSKWYLKNPDYQPDPKISAKLTALGDSALKTADVPVAALLLYNDHIIGEGYNTVNKSNLAGGHAEINAISSAMNIMGADSFAKLDRNKLTLITTWEPCPMCAGAIVEYNIRHVVMMKSKPLTQWFDQWKKQLHYNWIRQGSTTDTLQEHLFRKHPLYNEQKMKANS